MILDGSNQRELTSSNVEVCYPLVLLNGGIIACESEQPDDYEIYVSNPDRISQQRLNSHSANDRLPILPFDDQHILFASDQSDYADVYIINEDTESQLVIEAPARKGHSSWSVGGQLVFNASVELFWQTHISNLDTRNRQQLTSSNVDEFLPGRLNDTILGIYVMNEAGSNVRLDPRYEWGVVWSASGSWILFTGNQPDGTVAILIVNADGAEVHYLVGQCSYPPRTSVFCEEP